MQFASLPFECVFDILFRFGAMETLDRQHMTRFLLNHEVFSPYVVVWKLRHPALGIYLLRPEQKDIPDSVHAWSVVPGNLPPLKIVDAMQRFVAMRPAFRLHEWLGTPELMLQHVEPLQWVAYADECINAFRFVSKWKHSHKHDGDIYQFVVDQAGEEMQNLHQRLHLQEQIRITGDRKKPSFQTQQLIACLVERSEYQHSKLLGELDTLLRRQLPVSVFDSQFPYVAYLVAALAARHPLIVWNIKLLFHRCAMDNLGLDTWYIERALSCDAVCGQNPLQALRALK